MRCIRRTRCERLAAGKGPLIAVEQTRGRQRLNSHGAIELQTGKTRMLAAQTIDAASTIKLFIGFCQGSRQRCSNEQYTDEFSGRTVIIIHLTPGARK